VGLIIWLTGYPNSGKTTIAEKLIQSIKKNLSVIPVWIDGDSFRRILNISQNQTENDRIELGLKYARFAKEYCNQNHLVIVSTVAIYKEVYRELFNNGKENIQLFFIDADLEKRLERDMEIQKRLSKEKEILLSEEEKFNQVFGLNAIETADENHITL
jgi:adenylylsulfate kinase-like enzyme